jgi:hypothetical protein
LPSASPVQHLATSQTQASDTQQPPNLSSTYKNNPAAIKVGKRDYILKQIYRIGRNIRSAHPERSSNAMSRGKAPRYSNLEDLEEAHENIFSPDPSLAIAGEIPSV